MYNVEDNFNFYEELNKSLNETSASASATATNIENKRCLITNEPLKTHAVTLECKHSFNYMPLFNDILNHKKKFNSMERKMYSCKQIRCPYCRQIHENVLPFIEELGLEKIHGVNYVDIQNENKSFMNKTCCYSDSSVLCHLPGDKLSVVDGKYYCLKHNYIIFKKYLKMLNKKQKVENIVPCNAILKTGKNKGNSCGCKIFKENKCKRHFTPSTNVPEII